MLAVCAHSYNAGDDRTYRDWFGADGTIETAERYDYEEATARLLTVSTEDTAGNLTPIREFDYHASGQVSGDLRGANAYLYGLNDRGRLTTITRNGEDVATYIHDESEQRIAKTADGVTIHYHYDLDGRLISETDGTTGETLRDYVWLGLMPIAIIDAGDGAPDTACEEEVAELEALITDRINRVDTNAASIARLFGVISDRDSRIAEITEAVTRLEGLITDRETRIEANAVRITELGALITDKQSRIAANAERIEILNAAIADRDIRIANNEVRITELTALVESDQALLATLDSADDAARITTLTERIAFRQERAALLASNNETLAATSASQSVRVGELAEINTTLSDLITSHETRITELTDINVTLADINETQAARIIELETRNGELAALNTTNEERIDFLSERNILLSEQRVQFEADLAEAQANCDTGAADGLYYLHADHLGRPQFATDITGAVVWDMGEGVTPFGDSVNLAGAFAQRLMFPGQYADVETSTDGDNVTLSHNWHRTYDPTLGRYLQSDPIGLAGGLNRYAYVGGNPTSWVDPTGLNPAIDRRTGGHDRKFNEFQKRLHLYRNCYNVDLPKNPREARERNWLPQSDERNAFHINDVNSPGDRLNNKKWLSPDKRREVIFQGEEDDAPQDLSPQNAGTYNDGTNDFTHVILDVIPYFMYGNGPVTPTECQCTSIR